MFSLPRLLRLSVVSALFCHSVDAFAPHPSSNTPSFSRRSARATASPSQLFHQSNGELSDSVLVPYSSPMPTTSVSSATRTIGDCVRREWIDNSLNYYSKVMREERRRNLGQVKQEDYQSDEYNQEFLQLAKKHYFALRKIKDGKPRHAERIYRRIIDDLLHEEEEDDCDHAKLAVTTLLLALLLQRTGDTKTTRSVFLSFFRIVIAAAEKEPDHECACSAKVLQAFALFEMKQGNQFKSLEIVLKAVKLDPTLRPVLNWKLFRDTVARRAEQQLERLQQKARRAEQKLERLQQKSAATKAIDC